MKAPTKTKVGGGAQPLPAGGMKNTPSQGYVLRPALARTRAPRVSVHFVSFRTFCNVCF